MHSGPMQNVPGPLLDCGLVQAPCSTVALSNNLASKVGEPFEDAHHSLQRASLIIEFRSSQLVRLCDHQKEELAGMIARYWRCIDIAVNSLRIPVSLQKYRDAVAPYLINKYSYI